MKIIFLTHEEAADARVITHVKALLNETTETVVQGSLSAPVSSAEALAVRSIGLDAPDVGLPAAADVFLPQAPAGAPSTAGAGQFLTAPGVPLATSQNLDASPTPVPLLDFAALAPAAPVAPTPMSPAGIELDFDGLPWDARLHAGSKGKNKDGRWTAKRGLNNPALVARVTAELRQVLAVPAGGAVAAPLPSPFAPAPVAGSAVVTPDPTAAFAAPAAPLGFPPALTPAPLSAPAGGVSAVSPSEAFAKLVNRISPYTATGQLTPDRLQEVAVSVGMPSFPSLAARPDLHAQFATNLGLPAEVAA